MNWNLLPPKETIESVIVALKSHGFDAEVVATKEEAKEKMM